MKEYKQYYTSSLFNIIFNIDYKLKTTFINVFTNEDMEVFNKIVDKKVIYNSELHFFNYLNNVNRIITAIFKKSIVFSNKNIAFFKYICKNIKASTLPLIIYN